MLYLINLKRMPVSYTKAVLMSEIPLALGGEESLCMRGAHGWREEKRKPKQTIPKREEEHYIYICIYIWKLALNLLSINENLQISTCNK